MTAPAAARTDKFGERYYPIPHPDTGEVCDYPSITRVTKILTNFGLELWKQKRLAYVVATNPDLTALAATAEHEKARVLYDVVKQADSRLPSPANLGTAAHTFSEWSDAGQLDIDKLPPVVAPIMERYEALRGEYRWTVVTSEFTVFNHAVGYAGTGDRIIDLPGVGRVVADIKTGSLIYGDVALQLAAIANAEGVWDAETGAASPLPECSKDLGVIIHLPYVPKDAKSADGQLLLVDISEAFDGFKGCVAAYRWTNGPSKNAIRGQVERSSGPVTVPALNEAADGPPVAVEASAGGEASLSASSPAPSAVDKVAGLMATLEASVAAAKESRKRHSSDDPFVGLPGVDEDRRAAITKRLERLRAEYPDALAALARSWPEGVPTLKQSPVHSLTQLFAIEEAIWAVEAEFGVSWPTPEAMVKAAFPGAETVNLALPKLSYEALVMIPEAIAIDPHLFSALIYATTGSHDWPTSTPLTHLKAIVAAQQADYLRFIDTPDDIPFGALGLTPLLPRDGIETTLINRLGGKAQILAAGKKLAAEIGVPVPRRAAEVCEHPLLVALLLSERTQPTP